MQLSVGTDNHGLLGTFKDIIAKEGYVKFVWTKPIAHTGQNSWFIDLGGYTVDLFLHY